MAGHLSRIVSLILVFFMLIIAPLIYSYSISEMENRRLLLNDVTQFLDKVTDKGSITEDDLTEFSLQVNAHGMVIKPVVKRLVRTSIVTTDGEIRTINVSVDDLYSLNQRDTVQVKLVEVSMSVYRRLIKSILRVDEGPYTLEMAAVVR